MERHNTSKHLYKSWYQRPIAWAFIFLLFLISVISWVSLSSLDSIEEEYISSNQVQMKKQHLLDEMIHLSRQRAVLLRDIILTRDPFEKDEIILQHRNLATRYLLARNELSELPLNLQEKFLINSIVERTRQGYNLQLEIIELSLDDEEALARKLLTEELGPNRNLVYQSMLDLRELLVTSSGTAVNNVYNEIGISRRTVIWLYIATIFLGIIVAWLTYLQFNRGLKSIIWQASHDELTGLLNRQQFENYISDIVSEETEIKSKAALLYIDIDQFNMINNTSGHAAGDELLRQVTTNLRDCVDPEAKIGRVGGDQFAVLLADTNEEKAIQFTEKILRKTNEGRFLWRDRAYDVTLSIGILFTGTLQGNLDDIWTGAYISCDLAKEAGGNQYSIYQPDSHQIVTRQKQLAWSTRIKSALTNNHLVLFAQPIRNSDNQNVHNEILLRYVDDDGLALPAKNFIPAAERYNLITDVDLYVVRKTLDYMKNNDSKEIYAINLSGSTVGHKTIDREIIKLIDDNNIDPELICFEVTETIAITNQSNAIKFMNILHGIGCRFSLDDFGSGLSSFGYLRTLPIDTVKIDGYFVKNMEIDRANFSVIKSINNIAHGFGLKTIAECVENQYQLDSLKEIGIDYFQGFHIQKPEPLYTDNPEQDLTTIGQAMG